jgi:hypothetical protein
MEAFEKLSFCRDMRGMGILPMRSSGVIGN